LSCTTFETLNLEPEFCLFAGTAMFIEIDGGFFNRIEGNPIPPDGEFALFAGKLYGCVPMVFVTLFIIRIVKMFCHVFCPLLWLSVSF
jgi:hypothetical protein